ILQSDFSSASRIAKIVTRRDRKAARQSAALREYLPLPRGSRSARAGLIRGLMDPEANAAESRPSRDSPVHPDTDRLADQIAVGYESNIRKPAVRAVIAIVAHEEVVPGGHGPLEVGDAESGCQHDHVVCPTDALPSERRACKAVVVRVVAGRALWNDPAVDTQLIVPDH